MSSTARERYARKTEIDDLKRVFEKIDTKKDGKIDFEELQNVLILYKYKASKSEIEDMIWELDEDCDRCVSYSEYMSMYERCRTDTTGFEPRSLFNIIEFFMNDKDESGSVTVEEATQILYLRFGSSADAYIQEVFGTTDVHHNRELSLTEFVKSLRQSQKRKLKARVAPKILKNTTSGGGGGGGGEGGG